MPTNRISFSRYRRVLQIMKDDPLLKTKLSKDMVAINRGGQNAADVPKEAVYVTECIDKEGIDPNTVSKVGVVDRAFKLLVKGPVPDPLLPHYKFNKELAAGMAEFKNGSVKAVKSSKAKESEQEAAKPKTKPKAVKAPKPEPAKPITKPEKPKATRAPKPEPEPEPAEPEPAEPEPAEPEPVPEKPRPKAAKPKGPPSPKEKATAVSPAAVDPAAREHGAVESSAATSTVEALAVDMRKVFDRISRFVDIICVERKQESLLVYRPPLHLEILPGVPRLTGVAALNLGYGFINLFEPFMHEPKVKSICDRMLELLNEVHRLTIIPDAKTEPTAG